MLKSVYNISELFKSACDTLFRSGSVHFKDNLGGKASVHAVVVPLQTLYGVLHGHAFYPYRFRSHASRWLVMQPGRYLLSYDKGVYGFFTGSQVQAWGFAKNLPLSLQASVFVRKKPDSSKPCTVIADETKMTDPTDDAYKKS